MMRFLTAVCLFFVFSIFTSEFAQAQIPPDSPQFSTNEVSNLTWKAALMTGDDQIDVFDNARKTLTDVFLQSGVAPGNIKELSMSRAERVPGVLPSSAASLARALRDLSVGDQDACLIHMTSHGTREGFFLRNGPPITPSALNRILDDACGSRPTVVLISACYSGVFVSRAMLKPSRIILTAARSDLTSFGCSAEDHYTYWDGCLIQSLPKADSWRSLYGEIQQCVQTKESEGGFKPSFPQAYFGDRVAQLRIPKRVGKSLSASISISNASVAPDRTYRFGMTSTGDLKSGGSVRLPMNYTDDCDLEEPRR